MREIFIKLLNFLVYSNVYLAVGATCLALMSFLFFNVNPDVGILLIVFLLTLSMYNINRLTDVREDVVNLPDRSYAIKKHRKGLVYLILAGLISSCVLAFFRNVLSVLFIIFGLGLLYSVKWIPKKISKRYRRFKDILLVKNIVISATWSITTVLIVSQYLNLFNYSVLFLLVFVFLKLTINTIFFDMRDVKGDKKNGIKTVPVMLGMNKTRRLLYSVNVIVALFILFSVFLKLIPKLGYFLFLSTFYNAAYIYLFDKHRNNRYLFEIMADGEFIGIFLLVVVGSILM